MKWPEAIWDQRTEMLHMVIMKYCQLQMAPMTETSHHIYASCQEPKKWHQQNPSPPCQFMNWSCVFSFNLHANYWTIGYCHGINVIQFHENLDDFISGIHKPHSPNHVYTLGNFLKQTLPLEFEFDTKERTISQRLLGEVCDLTGEPRTIDTIYRCDHILEIVELTEIRTCQYELHINVPKLCLLPEFKRTNLEEGVSEILCTRIE